MENFFKTIGRKLALGLGVLLFFILLLGLPGVGEKNGSLNALAALEITQGPGPGQPPPHVDPPGKVWEFSGDVRNLHDPPGLDKEGKIIHDRPRGKPLAPKAPVSDTVLAQPSAGALAPAPSASQNFKGLTLTANGNGFPPDTNGDVGPNHYIQSVNTSMGIFSKTGQQLAAFQFNTLFSSANTGTSCDNGNQGDPVVIYDVSADRWIVTDFSFTGAGTSGPQYECLAISKSGDPVSGGWYFYAFLADDGTNFSDYPKFGVWPDGLYMSANMFVNPSQTSDFARVWAFNKDDLYNGLPLRSVHFDLNGVPADSLLPSNFRGGTPPPVGRPNFFTAIYGSSNSRLAAWKFHVDWTNQANSSLSGPAFINVAAWNTYTGPSGNGLVPQKNVSEQIDSLNDRLMMNNQYRVLNGVESLWVNHTVGNGSTLAAIRWYQLDVTGGVVGSAPVQQATYSPDSNHRFMGSLAVDITGAMALGYSVSSSNMFPAIRYAGRLAGDPAGVLAQAETSLIEGTGSQSGGSSRWGDYSAMSLDPADECTFWYTNEYYVNTGNNWQTRIGAFNFPGCLSLTTDAVTAQYGSSTTLTATLRYGQTNLPLANKTVFFRLNGSNAGSAVTGVNGVATLSNVSLAGINAGNYPQGITASFNSGTTLATAGLTIYPFPTTTSITASSGAAVSGDPISFTVSVTSTGGTPTGAVTLKENNINLASLNLINGSATFTTTNLEVGTPQVSAVFEGSIYFASSQSNTLGEQILCSPVYNAGNVVNTTDDGLAACGSFSYSINRANSSPTPFTLTLQTPAIAINGPLPGVGNLTGQPVTVTGSCLPAAQGLVLGIPGTTLTAGAQASSTGLTLTSNIWLKGVRMVDFSGYAVNLQGNGNTLSCNWFGTRDGVNPSNQGGGVLLTGNNNLIGIPGQPDSGNLISGNAGPGLTAQNGNSNRLNYNLIGFKADLTGPLKNGSGGIKAAPGVRLLLEKANRVRA